MSSKVNYCAGVAAEDSVARHYEGLGYCVARRRWRGGGGELDLILSRAGEYVFVEVKKSKTFAHAAQNLTVGQAKRLFQCANAFIATLATGLSTPCRFDVALVDSHGMIEVIPNAMHA